MLRNLEYVACYYITGSFKTQDYGYCMRAKHYRDLAYAVSFLPYYWRAMQVYNVLKLSGPTLTSSFVSICFLVKEVITYSDKDFFLIVFSSVLGDGLMKGRQATLSI